MNTEGAIILEDPQLLSGIPLIGNDWFEKALASRKIDKNTPIINIQSRIYDPKE